MATVFLGLGSNQGDREANIREACDRLGAHAGIRLICTSSLYESAPVGYTDQPDFVNAVAEIETDLSPHELLRVAHDIERAMGRVPTFRWGPRVVDVDLLLYDDAAMETPELVIPHPRMTERAFVITPLAEIAPDLLLPNGRKVGDVADKLSDQGVRKLPEVA